MVSLNTLLSSHREEELLILTKTYPVPSAKYRETACVAALTRAGAMRRLYPVPFRFLGGESKFKKWEWIRGVVKKANNDHRPESYRLDADFIQKLSEEVSSRNGWRHRLAYLEPHLVPSFEALETRRQESGETLGFVRPTRLLELQITPVKEVEWTETERLRLTQEGLFESESSRKAPPLRKLPFNFHYLYECQTPSGTVEHRHMITDWEVGALYWNCVSSHGSNWETPFRAKLETEFAHKDLIFLFGTVHKFPDQWLIIGLVYPPKPAPDPQSQLNFD